ncbi:MAG: GNAT family N-acetyltransferase [Steroidobacteraceae bacterium]
MPVSLRDARHFAEGRRWIEGVFPEYLDSLVAVSMNTGIFPVRGDFGDREPDMLARWFGDDSSYPLVILKNDKFVGFAVVSKPSPLQRGQIDFRMAEFFVTANQRRLGVGREAVQLIFSRFAGRWEVTENQSNKNAIAFWRAVVREYSSGQYRERLENGEVKQYFDSKLARGSGGHQSP